MESSLSRDKLESIDNKLRAELHGPGSYNPMFMFGKKQQVGITIPRDSRRMIPPLPKPIHVLQSNLSTNSLKDATEIAATESPSRNHQNYSTITPMSHHLKPGK